jgi:hypothetical protein
MPSVANAAVAVAALLLLLLLVLLFDDTECVEPDEWDRSRPPREKSPLS